MIGFVTLIFWACYTCSDEDDRVAFWRHDTLDVNLYLANQEFSFFFPFKILHSFFIETTSFFQAILYRFLLEKNAFWFKFKPLSNQHLKSVWLWNNFVVLFLLTHPNYRGLLAVYRKYNCKPCTLPQQKQHLLKHKPIILVSATAM